MISIIQRVTEAHVAVDKRSIATIGRGILALVAVEQADTLVQVERLAQRILNYRIFPDANDRMNLSLLDIQGELLLVPQFTLAADTRKGARPNFGPTASPVKGERLFDQLVEQFKAQPIHTGYGQFGADMQVSLINDGPVTFILRANPPDNG